MIQVSPGSHRGFGYWMRLLYLLWEEKQRLMVTLGAWALVLVCGMAFVLLACVGLIP